ncbi:MAG: DUF4115 domain-containing protein [Thermodesulfovibrio sp.]|uniref:helix-turn-helix domain-containing protein n=1 Tax=Thermodesulfovibrio sp. N1 TaxID=1871110 RepID=UPI00083B5A1B|nr:helix-turn-helix domain-containing protein [Thermodesulfovibrio sp. N1]MDI6714901.1 DUF4115 domain-containing protein [Thermodesulfovibrio sp.]ODA44513.1 Transcriptional regulator in cluster with unspecified monosaccharide ABC transport system [Thermodesulfovibrio sp. N1]
MSEELKNKRLQLGKSIEEIAEITKIKKSYLIAIEEGKFDELPIEVYTRSYIKIYSELLGVDPQQILREYENYLKSKKSKPDIIELPKIEKKEKKHFLPKPKQKWINAGLIIALVIILILLISKTWHKDNIPPPPPVNIEMKKEETPKAAENLQQKEETKTTDKQEEQNLIIEATDKVWMRITIDEKEKREFLLNPGQKIDLKASKFFHIHIGNAGGVKVFFNGKDLGSLGEKGQVVYLRLPEDKN